MCQADTQLIEIKHANAHINSNTKMLSGAGNTYFTADIEAKGLNLYLCLLYTSDAADEL